MTIVAAIPAYNEEIAIGSMIARAKAHVDEVLVIDDGSHDATVSVAELMGATVIIHEKNAGKGAALKTAFQWALARMFYTDHGLRTTCLCYFNVYGPRQDPNSAYAAAIPIFLSRARAGEKLVIYGDGGQTRDFVHVSDVVRANVAAMEHGDGEVFNVATGSSVTILELAENIVEITGTEAGIVHEAERAGDVRDSRADVGKISGWWRSEIELVEGLA